MEEGFAMELILIILLLFLLFGGGFGFYRVVITAVERPTALAG